MASQVIKKPASGLFNHKNRDKGLPLALRIFAVVVVLYFLVSVFDSFYSFYTFTMDASSGKTAMMGMSYNICLFIYWLMTIVVSALYCALFVLLILNKRKLAARTIYVIYGSIGVELITFVMTQGISFQIITYILGVLILVAMQIYLDPSLSAERAQERKEQDEIWRDEQVKGTLGFDETGKGAIEINFFNLFWIFVLCSFIGLVIELIYHFVVVVPGEIQDRAGLLFGPFSPIYGFGAVLMTIILNRLHKQPFPVIFVSSGIIGGLFEVFVSYFMQYAFGAVAWDYSSYPFSFFGGRTCLSFMCMWGVLGTFWLRVAMPGIVRMINKIPWNLRYTLTSVCAILMLVNAIMTLQALDCWYMRIAYGETNEIIETPISNFYATYFDNDFMQNRFESMSINPDAAVRSELN